MLNSTEARGLDLDAYLERIGYREARTPSRSVLDALHLAHVTHIPFENLDVLLGRAIRLDLESLTAKLVQARRGGYCFEHNLLFAAVLQQLGFAVMPLAARVRAGTERLLPRTHMVLRVEAEGVAFLADVGFGGEGLLLPLPLATASPIRQFAWTYRLVTQRGHWVLQLLRGDNVQDMYAFTEEPQHLVDYEVANYYVSTHPDSRFTQVLTAQLPTPEVRYILRNQEFTMDRGDSVRTTVIADEQLLGLLAERFGLHFPAGTIFRRHAADDSGPHKTP